jgi:chemotaxis response regulator CheB
MRVMLIEDGALARRTIPEPLDADSVEVAGLAGAGTRWCRSGRAKCPTRQVSNVLVVDVNLGSGRPRIA